MNTVDFLMSTSAVEEANKLLETVEGYVPKVFEFLVNVVIAIVLLIVGKFIIKYILKLCKKFFEKAKIELSIQKFLESLLKIVLYVVLVIIVCDKVGIDTASFIAVLGTLGVTVGLALQGSLSNFAGGVLILVLKPFVVGDYIVEDNNKNEGTVKEIQLFYTKLTTIDNKTIVIPNGMLTNNSLTNVTEKDERRLDLKIDISYDADLRKAKEVIQRLLDADDRIRKDEGMMIFVDSLGASSVVLGVRAWTKADDYWPVRWKLLEDIKLAMDEEGIEIPYQQMTVHVKEEA